MPGPRGPFLGGFQVCEACFEAFDFLVEGGYGVVGCVVRGVLLLEGMVDGLFSCVVGS